MKSSLCIALIVVSASCSLAHAQCTGADCVPPPPPSAYGAIPSTAVSETELLWPAAPPSIGVMHHPVLRRGRDLGLIAAGITLLSAGLTAQLILGATDQAARNCSSSATFRPVSCDSWGFGFIPFAGGFLVGMTNPQGFRVTITPGVIGGPVLFIPQALGLVFLMIAVHGYTEDLVPGVVVSPYASATDGGLTVTVAL